MNKLFFLLTSVALLSCGSGKNLETNEADYTREASTIAFENLSLQLLNLQEGETLNKCKDIEITLYVDAIGKTYSGKAGCNSYFGSIELVNEDQIKFLPGGQSEMMCEEEVMSWETRFLTALFSAPFSVTDRSANASFYTEGGSTVLTFTKVSAVSE